MHGINLGQVASEGTPGTQLYPSDNFNVGALGLRSLHQRGVTRTFTLVLDYTKKQNKINKNSCTKNVSKIK